MDFNTDPKTKRRRIQDTLQRSGLNNSPNREIARSRGHRPALGLSTRRGTDRVREPRPSMVRSHDRTARRPRPFAGSLANSSGLRATSSRPKRMSGRKWACRQSRESLPAAQRDRRRCLFRKGCGGGHGLCALGGLFFLKPLESPGKWLTSGRNRVKYYLNDHISINSRLMAVR